jgi:TolB-like protein
MSRLLAAALILLVFTLPVTAQDRLDKNKAAVVDFEVDADLSAESVMLSERLVESLAALAGLEVIPRKTVWKAKVDAKEEKAKYFDKPDTAAKLGKSLGVGKVFVGHIAKTGMTYILVLRAVDVETGKFISEHRMEHSGTIVDALSLTDILALKVGGTYEGPVITTGSLAEGRVGLSYADKLTIALPKKDKEKIKDIEWSIVDGALPDGLKIDTNSIIGIPEKPGLFTFTVRAGLETPRLRGGVEKILQIKVKPAPLTLPDQKLPLGRLGHLYSIEPKPPTGTPPFKWKLLEGSLPRGIVFNTSTGKIEGVPRATGTYKIKVSITDSLEPPETTSGWLDIEVTPSMNIKTAALPTGYTGSEYKAQLNVENGLPPFKVEVSAASSGLELTGSDKGLQISGRVKPSALDCRVLVRVSDSTTPEPQTAKRNYNVRINSFHVAQVISGDSLELHDFRLDRGGVPVILALMNILGSKTSWLTFCRWSGLEWTILPVTVAAKHGHYRILPTPEGPAAVVGYTETGNPSEVAIKVYRPSDKEWLSETIAAGKFRFVKAHTKPDGKLVFAYERDNKLFKLEKIEGFWKEELLLEGVIELRDMLYSSSGKAFYIYLNESGAPMLLEKSMTYSRVSELPDHPRCAGVDIQGNLRIFSSSLGESVCYVQVDNSFKEAGRWGRPLGAGAVFSKRDSAAYSPVPLRGEFASTDDFEIFCVSPTYIFSSITFDKSELRSRVYHIGSPRLAVDSRGDVHTAFFAAGTERGKNKVLVYGHVAGKGEFRKIARAKSFVRLTSQRELTMPKKAPGLNAKSGSCSLDAEGSPFALIIIVLLVPILLIRRKHILR